MDSSVSLLSRVHKVSPVAVTESLVTVFISPA